MTNHQTAGDKSAFRQRCQQALLHPVTLAALGLLLLNDLVLKGVWPNPWTTGKLSDLAWVIFASPLLAYLLSLPTPGGRRTQRAIWIAAYIGLPLLYAAFNTFAPVHDAILRGLSLISGGAGGSPLDAADSLVIPIGLAIALWIWRRGRTTLTIRRRHIAMAVAGLAVFAAIASSGPRPTSGVAGFMMTSDNRLFAHCGPVYGACSYETVDGGLTWKLANPTNLDGQQIAGSSVDTPRGSYSINEFGVMHPAGSSDPAYSTKYLRSVSAQWLQENATTHLWPQTLATMPDSIAYDARSDHVLVAMGIQGVVVGTPDGKWTRVAVGNFRPTDFSFAGKFVTILGSGAFSFLALILPSAVIALSMSMAAMRVGIPGDRTYAARIAATVFAVAAVLYAGVMLWNLDNIIGPGISEGIDAIMMLMLVAFGWALAFIALSWCWRAFSNRIFLITASVIALATLVWQILLVFLVWTSIDASLTFVKISVTIMAMLTGYALQHYLARKEEAALSEPPQAYFKDPGK